MLYQTTPASPAQAPPAADLLVPPGRTAGIAYYGLLASLLMVLLTPIWVTRYPAMLDYPNHLARAYVLHHLDDVPAYASTYEAAWRPIPNLAVDLVVHLLLYVVDIEIASRLFLTLLVASFALGCHLLGAAAHGQPTWMALPTMFLVYNFFLSSGFVNYVSGLGVYLMALAIWLRSRQHWTVGALLVTSLLACVAYLWHMASFGLLAVSAVLVVGLDTIRLRRLPGGRQLAGLAALAPPCVLWMMYMDPASSRPSLGWWHPLIIKKLIGLVYPMVAYRVYLDLVLGGILFALVFIAVVTAKRRLLHRELLVTGCTFLALYAICPMEGVVKSSYLDRRLVVPAVVLSLLSLNVSLPRWAGRVLLGGLVIVSLVRVGVITHFWVDVGGEIESQVRLLDRLPEGARIYPLTRQDASDISQYPRDMCFKNVVHYATIRRHTFSPSIFASPVTFPLGVKGSPNYIELRPGMAVSDIGWESILSRYDFLWGFNLRPQDEAFLSPRCDLIGREGRAVLFRPARGGS
jgi:hypothetical protein